MVYAVLRTGGKQHKVSVGDQFTVEKIPAEKGQKIEIDQVLAVGEGENLQVGTPVLEGAKVICEVIEQGRSRKVLVGKYKRRKGYYRKKGHRQWFTRLRVDSIHAEGLEIELESTAPPEKTSQPESTQTASPESKPPVSPVEEERTESAEEVSFSGVQDTDKKE